MARTASAPHAAQRCPNTLDRNHLLHLYPETSTQGRHGRDRGPSRGRPALLPEWVRAAPANAPGCRLRQARCSACPTQGWVKLAPPDRASTGGSGFSALRGDAKFGGLSCFFFRPHLALSSGPVAAQICGEAPEWGWDSTQPGWGAHSGPQVAQRRGHALCSLPGGTNSTPDFSAFRRARCRAAVCSSTAICWS